MGLALALSQGLNNFSETTETQVDGFELEQVLLTHDVLLMDLLTASQVTEIQFAAHEHASGVGSV